MSVLFIALPIALLLGASGMFACVYCIHSGQYEDLDTPSIRILVEEVDTVKRDSKPATSSPETDSDKK